MTVKTLAEEIKSGGYRERLSAVYGDSADAEARALRLADAFLAKYGDAEGAALFSAPARTELVGNHTDHALGRAVAAAVDLDIMALAVPCEGRVAIEGEESVDITLDGVGHPEERGRAASLARAMAEEFGGGFLAVTVSRIPIGAGLSSSAAFSLLCGLIADSFHGGGSADYMRLALAAKRAENLRYGKACGLLDQISCAHGGAVCIDFSCDPPAVSPVAFDASPYRICLVDTRVGHDGKDGEYAQIAADMDKAAAFFGKKKLGLVADDEFRSKEKLMQSKKSARVCRAALHFFNENKRVDFFCRRAALGKTFDCLYAVNGSGISSGANLGNVHKEAMELTAALKGIAAAVRIHGGGFGGAVQCYVLPEKEEAFYAASERLFGAGCVLPVSIREKGVCTI